MSSLKNHFHLIYSSSKYKYNIQIQIGQSCMSHGEKGKPVWWMNRINPNERIEQIAIGKLRNSNLKLSSHRSLLIRFEYILNEGLLDG